MVIAAKQHKQTQCDNDTGFKVNTSSWINNITQIQLKCTDRNTQWLITQY